MFAAYLCRQWTIISSLCSGGQQELLGSACVCVGAHGSTLLSSLLSCLQEVPVEVCSCVALRHLDVSKNRLLALPEHFSRLSHITQLNLTGE